MYINKAQLAHILLERSRIQGLSKHISKLTSRRNMRQENEAFMNLDSNQMTIHFNVLCSLMKRRILCKLNCRFIIRKSAKRNKNKNVTRTGMKTRTQQDANKNANNEIAERKHKPWALRMRRILLPVTLLTWAIPWESLRMTPIWDGVKPFFANLQIFSST